MRDCRHGRTRTIECQECEYEKFWFDMTLDVMIEEAAVETRPHIRQVVTKNIRCGDREYKVTLGVE